VADYTRFTNVEAARVATTALKSDFDSASDLTVTTGDAFIDTLGSRPISSK